MGAEETSVVLNERPVTEASRKPSARVLQAERGKRNLDRVNAEVGKGERDPHTKRRLPEERKPVTYTVAEEQIQMGYAEAIEWVTDHLDEAEVEVPNKRVGALWSWARGHQDKWMAAVLPRLVARGPEEKAEQRDEGSELSTADAVAFLNRLARRDSE